MEDRSQLPPDLPIQLPPSPLGDKYNVILALPSRMRQALMAVFHTSSFGLLIKPPEEDCSCIGQTFSSHTGRTSGLPFCSVIECYPGLTAKLKKLHSLGLDLTELQWIVDLRNEYIHSCRIYAGYGVGIDHGDKPILQASGPKVSF